MQGLFSADEVAVFDPDLLELELRTVFNLLEAVVLSLFEV